jgi:hypothetical protein
MEQLPFRLAQWIAHPAAPPHACAHDAPSAQKQKLSPGLHPREAW